MDSLVKAVFLRKQIRDSDKILRDMYSNLDLPPLRVPHAETERIYAIKQEVADMNMVVNEQYLYDVTVEMAEEADNDPYEVMVEEEEDDEENENFAEWLLPQPSVPPPEKEEVVETDRIFCCACAETFETIEEVKNHLRDVHGKDYDADAAEPRAKFLKHVVPCDLCGRKFDTKHQMEKHKFGYREMIACPTCGQLVRSNNLRSHLQRHSKEMVECDICHRSYKKAYIYEHKNKVHCTEKKWKCDQCPDKAFSTKAIMREHLKRHNPSFKRRVKAVCTVCDRKFVSKSAHRDHMFIHSGQKRYQCEHCTAAFMHLTDFKRHNWTHVGSPFSCKKCGKYMDRPSHLRAHEAAGCGGEYVGRRRNFKQFKGDDSKPDASSSEESESEDDVIEHNVEIQTESAGILSYSCGKCYDQFASESEFAMHMTTTHHGSKSIYSK
jgi:hypothetical protein